MLVTGTAHIFSLVHAPHCFQYEASRAGLVLQEQDPIAARSQFPTYDLTDQFIGAEAASRGFYRIVHAPTSPGINPLETGAHLQATRRR